MKIFSIKLSILALLFLVGCSRNSTPQPPIILTYECTLLGCGSKTNVFINGLSAKNYTVEFSDTHDTQVSITCILENYVPEKTITSSLIMKDPYFSEYWLNDEVPNFEACNNDNGHYLVFYQEAGVPITILKQCSEPPIYEFMYYSYCAYNGQRLDETPPGVYMNKVGNGVVLFGFSPDYLEVNFWSGLIKKTEVFHPDYDVEQPNGPNCEPTCKDTDIVINLP